MREVCRVSRQFRKGRGIRRGREIPVHKERNRVGVVGANAAAPARTVAIHVVEIDFLVAAYAITSGINLDIVQRVANFSTERPCR